MKLQPIEKREGLTSEEFREEYLLPRKPVIFKDLIKDWPATEKWTFDWFRKNYGHLEVPLFGNDFHDAGKHYMTSKRKMKFGDYLTLIENEPTELRMFLYNLFDHAPELVNDFNMPNIINGWNKRYYYMFFGGQGSSVNLHYDIDCSHVFLSQFQTRKKVYLFAPDQGELLYHQPFTVKSQMDVNNPDYEKYPALKYVEGLTGTLEHGETLFMPSQYWHHMEYIEGGFGLALRAYTDWTMLAGAAKNLATHFVIDKGLNQLMGEKWSHWKKEKARENAHQAMQKIEMA